MECAERLIDPHTVLVAVSYADGETGIIQPIQELATISHRNGTQLHCDMTYALGKEELHLTRLQVDSASFESWFVHGPPSTGAIYLARPSRWPTIYRGPGLGRVMRGDVPWDDIPWDAQSTALNGVILAGFATALKLIRENNLQQIRHMEKLRHYWEENLMEHCPECVIVGRQCPRLSNTNCVIVPDIPIDDLCTRLQQYDFGKGNEWVEMYEEEEFYGSSHVLRRMGLETEAHKLLTISVSCYTTMEEIEQFTADFIQAVWDYRAQYKLKSNREVKGD